MKPQPKPIRGWLLGVLIIVILIAGGFYGWQYLSSKQTQPTTKESSDELTSLDSDLKGLDQNFGQLENINDSDDQAPTF